MSPRGLPPMTPKGGQQGKTTPVRARTPVQRSKTPTASTCPSPHFHRTSSGGAQQEAKTIRVYLRVRPAMSGEDGTAVVPLQDPEECLVRFKRHPEDEGVQEDVQERIFNFHNVFNAQAQQEDVYNMVAKETVNDVFRGYHGLIFCYGQTGTGKTYTLCNPTPGYEGIIPRSIKDIFEHVDRTSNDFSYECSLSMVQLYQENFQDLFSKEGTAVHMHDDPEIDNGVLLEGVQAHKVQSAEQCLALYLKGADKRAVGATLINERSSRSHTIVILNVNTKKKTAQGGVEDRTELRGRLILVDLAGSERVKRSGATGVRLGETKFINKSLMILGRVVHSLTDTRSAHVPFRDSKLTRLLQYALLGNGKTSIVINVSPSEQSSDETVSAVQFGQRAMKVKQNARVHENTDYRALAVKLQAMLTKREDEIRALVAAENNVTVEALEERIRELEDRLSEQLDAHADLLLLKTQKETLEQRVMESEEMTRQCEGEANVMLQYMEKTDEQLNGLKMQYAELEEQNSMLHEALEQAKTYCSDLLDRQAGGDFAGDELTPPRTSLIGPLELHHLQDQLAGCEQLVERRHSDIASHLQRATAVIDANRVAVEKLTTETSTLRAEVEMGRTESEALKERCRQLESSLAAEQERATNAEASAAALRAEADSLQSAVVAVEQQVVKKSEELLCVRGAAEGANEENARLVAQLHNLAEEQANQGVHVVTERNAAQELRVQILNLEMELDAERRRGEVAEAECDTVKHAVATQGSELSEARESVEVLREEVVRLRQQLHNTTIKSEYETQRLAEAERNLEFAAEQNRELEEAAGYLAQELEAAQNREFHKGKKKDRVLFRRDNEEKEAALAKKDLMGRKHLKANHIELLHDNSKDKGKAADEGREKQSLWRGIINKSRSGKGVSVVFTDMELLGAGISSPNPTPAPPPAYPMPSATPRQETNGQASLMSQVYASPTGSSSVLSTPTLSPSVQQGATWSSPSPQKLPTGASTTFTPPQVPPLPPHPTGGSSYSGGYSGYGHAVPASPHPSMGGGASARSTTPSILSPRLRSRSALGAPLATHPNSSSRATPPPPNPTSAYAGGVGSVASVGSVGSENVFSI